VPFAAQYQIAFSCKLTTGEIIYRIADGRCRNIAALHELLEQGSMGSDINLSTLLGVTPLNGLPHPWGVECGLRFVAAGLDRHIPQSIICRQVISCFLHSAGPLLPRAGAAQII